jgi:Family of unknown function (DUF6152)
MKSKIKVLVIMMLFMAVQAQAHHSAAMFDAGKTIELSGTIKEFQWKNPHVWIQVMVKNADGTTKEWSVEGMGPNSLSRDGWRPSTFKPGDSVTLKVHPMRDGSAAGNFVGAKWADGRTIGEY